MLMTWNTNPRRKPALIMSRQPHMLDKNCIRGQAINYYPRLWKIKVMSEITNDGYTHKLTALAAKYRRQICFRRFWPKKPIIPYTA